MQVSGQFFLFGLILPCLIIIIIVIIITTTTTITLISFSSVVYHLNHYYHFFYTSRLSSLALTVCLGCLGSSAGRGVTLRQKKALSLLSALSMAKCSLPFRQLAMHSALWCTEMCVPSGRHDWCLKLNTTPSLRKQTTKPKARWIFIRQ